MRSEEERHCGDWLMKIYLFTFPQACYVFLNHAVFVVGYEDVSFVGYVPCSRELSYNIQQSWRCVVRW